MEAVCLAKYLNDRQIFLNSQNFSYLWQATNVLVNPIKNANANTDMRVVRGVRSAPTGASEQLLPDFYCEHTTLAMNRERRRQVASWISTFHSLFPIRFFVVPCENIAPLSNTLIAYYFNVLLSLVCYLRDIFSHKIMNETRKMFYDNIDNKTVKVGKLKKRFNQPF